MSPGESSGSEEGAHLEEHEGKSNDLEDDESLPRATSTSAKVVILVVAAIGAVAVGECFLRFAWTNPYRNEEVAQFVELRAPAPRTDRIFDRSPIDPDEPIVRFRTNARGYIEPAERISERDLTVVFLGGSTTECSLVQEDLRFPALTETLLRERGFAINALNYGRSGNNAHHSLNNLLNHVVDDEPEVVVLMHAANDIGQLRRTGSYGIAMGEIPGIGMAGRVLLQYASSLSSVVGLARHVKAALAGRRQMEKERKFAPSSVSKTSIEAFKARLRAFVGVSRAFGIVPVLMTQPSGGFASPLRPDWVNDSDQALFNQLIREVAQAEDAELIDLAAVVEARPERESEQTIFYDGIHVTDHGSRIYAEQIARRLEVILGQEPLAAGVVHRSRN